MVLDLLITIHLIVRYNKNLIITWNLIKVNYINCNYRVYMNILEIINNYYLKNQYKKVLIICKIKEKYLKIKYL